MAIMSTALAPLLPITIGVDVGQIHDNTALAVAEVASVHTGKYHFLREQTMGAHIGGVWVPPKGAEPVMRSEYTIRHITRLPLGMSYPDVAIHIADMLCNPLFAHRQVRLLLDVTGVGRPVYDDLRREIKLRKEAQHVMLKPISFVHGERYNRSTGTLGKAFLVSRLQSLLQSKRVHGPDTPEMRATLDELRVYEIKVSDEGKETFGGKIGHHDDLATALGLCCLDDPYAEKPTISQRIY